MSDAPPRFFSASRCQTCQTLNTLTITHSNKSGVEREGGEGCVDCWSFSIFNITDKRYIDNPILIHSFPLASITHVCGRVSFFQYEAANTSYFRLYPCLFFLDFVLISNTIRIHSHTAPIDDAAQHGATEKYNLPSTHSILVVIKISWHPNPNLSTDTRTSTMA